MTASGPALNAVGVTVTPTSLSDCLEQALLQADQRRGVGEVGEEAEPQRRDLLAAAARRARAGVGGRGRPACRERERGDGESGGQGRAAEGESHRDLIPMFPTGLQGNYHASRREPTRGSVRSVGPVRYGAS